MGSTHITNCTHQQQIPLQPCSITSIRLPQLVHDVSALWPHHDKSRLSSMQRKGGSGPRPRARANVVAQPTDNSLQFRDDGLSAMSDQLSTHGLVMGHVPRAAKVQWCEAFTNCIDLLASKPMLVSNTMSWFLPKVLWTSDEVADEPTSMSTHLPKPGHADNSNQTTNRNDSKAIALGAGDVVLLK